MRRLPISPLELDGPLLRFIANHKHIGYGLIQKGTEILLNITFRNAFQKKTEPGKDSTE
jgi:hypothetical protein